MLIPALVVAPGILASARVADSIPARIAPRVGRGLGTRLSCHADPGRTTLLSLSRFCREEHRHHPGGDGDLSR
jgi:hypothetical protein